ncbi:TldD/PmbA family protein [Candidatus Thorarchaeota archaeon]|nr:MAG: TldD/PmbA family protein [Candidatus Thorarchaeota archaeon]
MSTLYDVANKALRVAEKEGAQQSEAYVSSTKSFQIEVENSAVKGAEDSLDQGCGIRSIVDKKIGFAYVTNLNPKEVATAGRKSAELAKNSIPDPDFVTLPYEQSSYPTISGLFDSTMSKVNADEAAELMIAAVDSALNVLDGRNPAIEGKITIRINERAIVNSLGIESSTKSTIAYLYTYPTIKESGQQTSGYEFQVTRKMNDIDPHWVGEESAKSALANLGPKTIEGGMLPVILTPLAVSSIIGLGFAGALDAEEIQYGRSYVSDDIGSMIGSSELTITDNGTLEGGIGSRPFDAEGVRSQRTSIMEAGVLKNYLHNSYTANKDRVDNTANATRPSYAGLPGISTSNFIVAPGHGTVDDLISEIDQGVLCRNTADRPNMTTGELSAMIMEGSYIENGEIQHPLKNTLIGINMRDLLKRISLVGADTRTTFSIKSPSVVLETARITSG